jgi:hypothetical protein
MYKMKARAYVLLMWSQKLNPVMSSVMSIRLKIHIYFVCVWLLNKNLL